MNDHALLQLLQTQTAICTAALLLVFLVRIACLRQGYPTLAYASWLLIPLALAASLLPHPTTEWPVPGMSLPSVTTIYGTALETAPESTLGPRLWILVWLAGALVAFALMVWQQLRFASRLGPLEAMGIPRVCRSSHESVGPLLIGLFRPCIIVPADFASRYSEQEQALILAHEQTHLQRGDLVANALAAMVQVAFWFNPLVYLAAARFRFDQELACDAAVIQQYPQLRQSYANTILKTHMSASRLPVGCHWQAHQPLKERIMQLTRRSPRPARNLVLQALLMTLAMCSCYGAWAVSSTASRPVAPAQDASRIPAEVLPLPVESGTNPPTEAIAPANGYNVDFTHRTLTYAGKKLSKTNTIRAPSMPVMPGRPIYFNQGSDEHRCNFKLALQPYPSQPGTSLVFADLEIKCKDIEEAMSHPKLVTKLGTTASVRFGTYDQIAHEFTILVTPKAL